jgi:DNA-binding MarR family transcriptional regulator
MKKNRTDMIPGGYGSVQRLVMKSKTISLSAKALYALLCSYTGHSGYCWPAQDTMASDLSITVRTISRLLNELENDGLIRREKLFSDMRTNVKYKVCFIAKDDSEKMPLDTDI